MTGGRGVPLVLTDDERRANTVHLKTDLYYQRPGVGPVLWTIRHACGWSASGISPDVDTARAAMDGAVDGALVRAGMVPGGGRVHIVTRAPEDPPDGPPWN